MDLNHRFRISSPIFAVGVFSFSLSSLTNASSTGDSVYKTPEGIAFPSIKIMELKSAAGVFSFCYLTCGILVPLGDSSFNRLDSAS